MNAQPNKASCSNPHPTFTCCMQNYILLVLFCLSRHLEHSMCLLLHDYPGCLYWKGHLWCFKIYFQSVNLFKNVLSLKFIINTIEVVNFLISSSIFLSSIFPSFYLLPFYLLPFYRLYFYFLYFYLLSSILLSYVFLSYVFLSSIFLSSILFLSLYHYLKT